MKPACATLAILLALAGASAAATLKGDGPGCKDKALGARLAALTDMDPEYIEIWAKGMQDQSCRGYSAGQEVSVDERADGLACVRASDDTECFWVRGDMAP